MNERKEAVRITDVTKMYGDVRALDDLTLSIDGDENYGLLGTNGAGKTTLFRLLVGHTQPDCGSVEVLGRDVGEAGRDVRRSVGYLPQDAGFPAGLTAREVLTYHAGMHGIPKEERSERVEDALETVGLVDSADRRIKGYSGGMELRLGLATATLPRPDVLLLDEPTAGLDPLGVQEFHRSIEDLHRDTVSTVVVSTHVLSEAEELCDRIAILHEGRLQAEGSTDDLKSRFGGTDGGLEVVFRQAVTGSGIDGEVDA